MGSMSGNRRPQETGRRVMRTIDQVVHGGGWLTRETTGKPWTRFFGFVSLMWIGVSVCASIPFWNGWPAAFGRLEWCCVVMLVPQPIFLIAAIVFYVRERPRTFTEHFPN